MVDKSNMHFFRHDLVRRITLFVLLSWGSLTQVSTVYACESENGNKQISCCCDNAIKKDCKDQQSKASKSKCDKSNSELGENILDTPIPPASACCEISYGATDTSIVASNTLSALQVVLLDAPQPPPLMPCKLYGLTFYGVSLPDLFVSNFTPTTDIYLVTQRLRI